MEVGQGPNWGCSAKEKKKATTTVINPDYSPDISTNTEPSNVM
jgi:hypothetical protein